MAWLPCSRTMVLIDSGHTASGTELPAGAFRSARAHLETVVRTALAARQTVMFRLLGDARHTGRHHEMLHSGRARQDIEEPTL
jgi:hypothetical protein